MFKKKCALFGTGPVFPVNDVGASVDFYCQTLGFTLDFVMGDPPDHGSVTRDKVGIQFTRSPEPFDARAYPGWTYFFVENIDLFYAELAARGVNVTQALESRDHGMREFEIRDVNGFRLRFGQYL
ncbi:MAG: VOC family protein [Betaproteobacteria bacterium]|nr:VOC family protein [Betaproteobacteria bacterium]